MSFTCLGTLYYGPDGSEKALCDFIWDEYFGYDFKRIFSLQGIWVFHSLQLNQCLVLVSRKNIVLAKGYRTTWKAFEVYADKNLDLEDVFKRFSFPKIKETQTK